MATDGHHLLWLDESGLHVQRPNDLSAGGMVGHLWTIGRPRALAVDGDRVYAAVDARYDHDTAGLRIVDVAAPGGPVVLDGAATEGQLSAVAAADGQAHCASPPGSDEYGAAGVWSVGLRDGETVGYTNWTYPYALNQYPGLGSHRRAQPARLRDP